MKKRSFMCTIHYGDSDPYSAVPDFSKMVGLKRAMGQLELGEKTGKKHWQIFLEFSYPIDPKRLHGLGMHVDGSKAFKHPKAGRNYVRKDTPFLNSRFDWPDDDSAFTKVKECRRLESKSIEAYNKVILFDQRREDVKELLRANIAECKFFLKCSLDEKV